MTVQFAKSEHLNSIYMGVQVRAQSERGTTERERVSSKVEETTTTDATLLPVVVHVCGVLHAR